MNRKFIVPFDTALFLKRKEYPQKDSDWFYDIYGYLYTRAQLEAEHKENFPKMVDYYFAAPTYHEVVDWLLGKGYPIESACIREYSDSDVKWLCGVEYTRTRICPTREEALNEIILKVLEKM